MLFKGNSSKLELLIGKIQANKENQTGEDISDSKPIGTEAASSWRSETPEDQTSLSPGSSCATPTSTTDTTEAELAFTIGVTEATPYACQFCEKAFPRLSYLKKHEQTHSDLMPFKCDFCNRLFKHKRSRDRHIKLHTGDKKYRCTQCESAFSRSDHLKIHMKTHDNQKPFQCTVCNRGYNTAAALTSHMQNHKKESNTPSPGPFRCLQCTSTFISAEELQSHTSTNHLSNQDGRITPSMSPIKREKMTTPSPSFNLHHSIRDFLMFPAPKLACIYCTKDTFTTMESLQLHVQAMHGPILNGDFSELAAVHTHLSSPHHFPSPTVSPSASRMSTTSNGSLHLPYICEFCTMKFSSLQLLQKHTLTVHSLSNLITKAKENVFCAQCAIAFPSATTFAEHFLLLHSSGAKQPVPPSPPPQLKPTDLSKKSKSESPPCASASKRAKLENGGSSSAASTSSTPPIASPIFSISQYQHPGTLLCNQCNAAFPDFESFRTHLKTHLDEIVHKYVCSECQGEFPNEEQLDNHILSHYLCTTTEYGCQCCMKLFSKPDELQKHLMDIHAHHLYRCSLCKDMFDSKVSIQVHFAVKHSNECKLFKCTTCSSVFRSEMEFQVHVKVAHQRKAQPFRCLLCNTSFATEMELQYHLTTHQKQFPCTHCDEAFHVEFLLDKHMQSHHTTEVNAADSTIPENLTMSAKQITTNCKSNRFSSAQKKDPKCDICDRAFLTDSELTAHRKQMHNIKSANQKSPPTLSLHCAYCSENCKSRTELENHMKTHQSSTGKHKCNICDEVCPTATILAEHKLTHCKVLTGSLCTSCKVNLKGEEQFYTHLQQHNNPGLPIPCVVCRQTLMTEIEVQMHAKFHIKNCEPLFPCCVCMKQLENQNLIVNGITNNTQTYICKECFHRNTNDRPTDIRCTECQVKFESEAELDKHLLTHKKTYTCIKCQMSFETEKEIQMHVATHLMNEGNNHECHLCHKFYDTPLKLQCHLIEHTFEGCGSFSCYMCSAVYTAASGLQQHMLEHGLSSRPYDCSFCHLKFFFRAELENHLFCHPESSTRSDDDYQCLDCTRTFISALALATHREKVHSPSSDYNGFRCSLCPEVYETSVEMQKHYFKSHSASDLNAPKAIYKCGECELDFLTVTALESHAVRMHGNNTKRRYSCTECNKEFSRSRNLHNHVKLHHGQPDECPICRKKLSKRETLKNHMKIHDDESSDKLYSCPQCDKQFSLKYHVTEHVKTEHSLDQVPELTCHTCSKTFRSFKKLEKHIKSHDELHVEELDNLTPNSTEIKEEVSDDCSSSAEMADDSVDKKSESNT